MNKSTDRKLIALISEEWVSVDQNINNLAKKHGISAGTISSWLTRYYLPKRLSNATEVRVYQSKINTEEV